MQFSKANQWQAKSGVRSSLFICIHFLNLNIKNEMTLCQVKANNSAPQNTIIDEE